MSLDKEKPIGEAEFSKLMRVLGPFERRPKLAIGFSGGADSTGLLVLAARWAKRRNGVIFALTVDHGLRADSLSESLIRSIFLLNKLNPATYFSALIFFGFGKFILFS